MSKTNNKELTPYSQKLRKQMTKEERHLWYDFLKQLDVTVNRQKVIGNYILDFYIAKYKLAVEIDGTQHFETVGKEKDSVRDDYLNNLGIAVLRYSNYDVNNEFESVCEDILKHLKASP